MDGFYNFLIAFSILFFPAAIICIEIHFNFAMCKSLGRFIASIYRLFKKYYRSLMKKHFKKRYKTIKQLTEKKYTYQFKRLIVLNKDNECLKVSVIKKSNYSVKRFEIYYLKKEPEVRIYKTKEKEKTKIINI